MKYKDKLKHPKWQRKRLETFQRDEWSCQNCGETELTLHVHHKHYERGKNPWEYNIDDLVTLCDRCHIEKHLFAESAIENLDTFIDTLSVDIAKYYELKEILNVKR